MKLMRIRAKTGYYYYEQLSKWHTNKKVRQIYFFQTKDVRLIL